MRFSLVPLWFCVLAAAICAEPEQNSLTEARRLYLTGRYDEALEQLGQLGVDGGFDVSITKSRVFRERGNTAAAVMLLTTAAESAPSAADAAPAYAELALLQLEQGRHDEAEQAAAAALDGDGNLLAARWVQTELLRRCGKLDEASEAYRWFVDFYNRTDKFTSPDDLRWIGRAAAQYARWNRLPDQFSFLVNELYPQALKLEANYWPAHLEAGRLFLEKYNQADALRELAAARRINPNSADVLSALAELAIQKFELDEARRLLARAREINAQHVPTRLLEADIALAMFDPLTALGLLETARKFNPHHEPTLGRLAAVYGLLDGTLGDGWEDAGFGARPGTGPDESGSTQNRLAEIIAEVTTANPHAGDFYFHLGQALDKGRKFPAAERAFQKAVDVMPRRVGPRAQLGLMQMRLGDEVAAQRTLDASFEIDPFNVRVKNSLAVLDVLAGYTDEMTAHFILRYDPQHDRVLAKCAARYLERVYPELTARLGYEPPKPSLIEFFNRAKNTDGHGWFSARMVGLPRVHTIGACAGKMVALTSPTSMPRKRFHWARVLRHELVHVINLQQTNFNIPHWYTEALAVLLEERPRPAEWNVLLAKRVPQGEVFRLDTINLGFIRPRSGDDWQMAYCQAELYAQYMVERFGDDALVQLLAAYADGLQTAAAIERSFGVSLADFEKGYAERLSEIAAQASAHVRPVRKFAELKKAHEKDPQSAEAAAELAIAYLQRKEYPAARRLAEEALAVEANHQLASFVLAKLSLVVGERTAAAERLAACLDEENPRPEVLQLLANLRLGDGDADEALRLLKIGAANEPGDPDWTRRLAAVALKRGDREELAGYLRDLATVEGDNLVIRKKLALLAAARGDHAAAARWAEDATFIDVLDLEMHILHARSRARLDRPEEAAAAYEICADLAPDRREIRLEWAKVCLAAGQDGQAKVALRPLLDAGDPAARALAEEIDP